LKVEALKGCWFERGLGGWEANLHLLFLRFYMQLAGVGVSFFFNSSLCISSYIYTSSSIVVAWLHYLRGLAEQQQQHLQQEVVGE